MPLIITHLRRAKSAPNGTGKNAVYNPPMREVVAANAEKGGGALDCFLRLSDCYPREVIARKLGLHNNTLARWRETMNVPRHYAADLRRLLNNGNAPANEQGSDRYYTKKTTAAECCQMLHKTAAQLRVDLSDYHFIEPSAGCGGFYDELPPKRRIGVDIQPLREGLIRADYLQWTPPPDKKYVVVGNPPFGLRGHLALLFINHSARFADMAAFILPQLFASDGKGVPGKRVQGYQLAFSQKLPLDSFYYPDGRDVNIATVFQVWTKVNTHHIRRPPQKTCHSFVRVYSLSDGGTPSSTRNKKMIGNCDIYLPSTCFSGMRAYGSFAELPNKRGYGIVIRKNKRAIKKLLADSDWKKHAFLSTNSALNLRRSIIEQVVADGGYFDA
ncbi:MAG: SAM-dependent methyltransferase [Gammaproteobacteria bacterium]